jgi:hypothetical protein
MIRGLTVKSKYVAHWEMEQAASTEHLVRWMKRLLLCRGSLAHCESSNAIMAFYYSERVVDTLNNAPHYAALYAPNAENVSNNEKRFLANTKHIHQ